VKANTLLRKQLQITLFFSGSKHSNFHHQFHTTVPAFHFYYPNQQQYQQMLKCFHKA